MTLAHSKLHRHCEPGSWQKQLGKTLESPMVIGSVLMLVIIDLYSSVINYVMENTDWLAHKYHKEGEKIAHVTWVISVTILSIFFVEQLLHLLCFGWKYFEHLWYVLDLFVVSVSLFAELVLEGKVQDVVSLLIVLRLWKVMVFVFDVFLARHTHLGMLHGQADDEEYGATALLTKKQAA
mmetsp:Transcript_103612/g.195119  ORF Transcript_103612/g.195119 Transcript_103612/m.195119 type:complete len:180 (+) Transcript_103612:47-586(+)